MIYNQKVIYDQESESSVRDVKKMSSEIEVVERLTGKAIREIREYLGQSLAEFGLTLKRAIDPRAEKGFSRQYISALENEKEGFEVTDEIEAAIWNIRTVIDGAPAGTGAAVYVRILALPGQVEDGSFLPRNAEVVTCERPGCPVRFIKTHPSQKYHDPECQRLWSNEKRRKTF